MEPPPEDQKAGGTSSGGRGSPNSIANNDNNKATTTAKTIKHQVEQQPLEGFPDGWNERKIPIKAGGTEYTYHYSPLEQHIFNSSKYI